MNEAALKQLEKVQASLDTLKAILSDTDIEKRRISQLVSGTPDLHIRNPDLYKQMAQYADPKKPPFTAEGWVMTMRMHEDTRLTYEQIERFNAGLTDPSQPWDDLVKP